MAPKQDLSLFKDINRLDELETAVAQKRITESQLKPYQLYRNAGGLLDSYFKNVNGSLQYGNYFKKFKPIDYNAIALKLSLGGYTPFQLMTLRESARNYYEVAIKNEPKTKGIFDVERKRYVVLPSEGDPQFERYVKRKWSGFREVEIPENYLNRKYRDVTDDMYEEYHANVQAIGVEEFELNEEEIQEEANRATGIQEYQKNLEVEVKTFYPDIDELIALANGCGGCILLYPPFATVAYHTENTKFVYLKTIGVMWDGNYLTKRDFESAIDSPFCNQVYKVIDYLSGKLFKSNIKEFLKNIVFNDEGNLTEEKVRNTEWFIYSGSRISDQSLAEELDFYKTKIPE